VLHEYRMVETPETSTPFDADDKPVPLSKTPKR
jgi:hypothetical protein